MEAIVSGAINGVFALAGVALGGVLEYLRERWARQRDAEGRRVQRDRERTEFQRKALLELQETILALSLETAEALGHANYDRNHLRGSAFRTGMVAARVFDARARQLVDETLNSISRLRTEMDAAGGAVSEKEGETFTAVSYTALDRIREVLESHYQ